MNRCAVRPGTDIELAAEPSHARGHTGNANSQGCWLATTVSQATMRKSLDLLEGEHLITRRQGRGSFVNDPGSQDLARRFNNIHLANDMRVGDEATTHDILAAAAGESECARLRLASGDTVYRITRTRAHLRKVFMIEHASMPAALFPNLTERAIPSHRLAETPAKVQIALWIVGLVGALAFCEWLLAPGGGRHRMDSFGTGPGPARALVMREWKPNTDFRFVPVPERNQYPQGGLRKTYEIATDAEGFIEPSRRHERPDVSIVFLGGSTTECMFVARRRIGFRTWSRASSKMSST